MTSSQLQQQQKAMNSTTTTTTTTTITTTMTTTTATSTAQPQDNEEQQQQQQQQQRPHEIVDLKDFHPDKNNNNLLEQRCHHDDEYEYEDDHVSAVSSSQDTLLTMKAHDNASKKENDQLKEIANKESTAVRRWRTVVGIMLLITAALVVSSTYVFLTRAKYSEFVKSFQQSARTIQDAAEFTARNDILAMESFADALTAQALTMNTTTTTTATTATTAATWPFVTFTNFEILAARARVASFSECIFFMPFVPGKKRLEWEEYSRIHHEEWISNSQLLFQEQTSVWVEENHGFKTNTNANDNDEHSSNGRRRRRRRHLRGTLHTNQQGQKVLQPLHTTVKHDSNVGGHPDEMLESSTLPSSSTTTTTTTIPSRQRYAKTTTTTTIPNNNNDNHISRVTSKVNNNNTTTTTTISPKIFIKAEDYTGSHEGDVSQVVDIRRLHYAPVWQVSPPPYNPKLINYNFLGDSVSARLFNAIEASGGQVVVSELLKTSTINFFYDGILTTEQHYLYHDSSQSAAQEEVVVVEEEDDNDDDDDDDATTSKRRISPGSFPHSVTMAPVYKNFVGSDANTIVGYVAGIAPWDLYLSRLLPQGVNGVFAVLSNSCSQEVTYEINGPVATYLGQGDLHQEAYDHVKETLVFTGFGSSTHASRRAGQCDYVLELYASDVYRNEFDNRQAISYTIILAVVFLVTGTFFFVFVVYVQLRNNIVMDTAVRTTAIVSSLFPSNVRDRMMEEEAVAAANAKHKQDKHKQNHAAGRLFFSNHNNNNNKNGNQLRTPTSSTTMNNNPAAVVFRDQRRAETIELKRGATQSSNHVFGSAPIADFFPHTTLLFADLVGFTAWSSVREPSQVFTLLESIYHAFDLVAKKRNIFKVETVGDCYVACAGLPEPRNDHAVVMARFAHHCRNMLGPLVKQLETTLGPDTGDLSMRFGLHSGSVTAGVLRGDRARFQLFGDSVNTASRIETTGESGRIHISKETADLLIQAQKSHWIIPRKDKVIAKGKGELETFWLEVKSKHASSFLMATATESDGGRITTTESAAGSDYYHSNTFHDDDYYCVSQALSTIIDDEKILRLIDWNVDLFIGLLRRVEARRETLKVKTTILHAPTMRRKKNRHVIDEVKEIVPLPTFDPAVAAKEVNPESLDLGFHVEREIRDYITSIAMRYRENPFHNFEHASHVTMSVVKLMSRIVNPFTSKLTSTNNNNSRESSSKAQAHELLHDHTYGITSDPLTQFACMFSALIHDVDHPGVPNTQLVKEGANIAKLYKNKSVAEQNSVDIAWELLLEDRFSNLQQTIFANAEELKRFRALVVNSVMATDIMDKDLKALRNARWERAFIEQQASSSSTTTTAAPAATTSTSTPRNESEKDKVDRKATIVIEHLIQASDVCHTMQHWHIYRKWNERLFREMYRAYKDGRAEKDPSEVWYLGELSFFDYYIIPLAKKLKDCGVFGVSCVEYLNYAETNREEWELKGQKVVADMMETIRQEEKIAAAAAMAPVVVPDELVVDCGDTAERGRHDEMDIISLMKDDDEEEISIGDPDETHLIQDVAEQDLATRRNDSVVAVNKLLDMEEKKEDEVVTCGENESNIVDESEPETLEA